MRYINIIDSFYPSLSKGERKVAEYVMATKENIVYQTLSEISKSVNVGEATIVRFCHKIGFDGFYDFKLAVAKEQPQTLKKETEHFIDCIDDNLQNAIISTRQILNIDEVNKAVNLISQYDKIFIYGIGSSGHTALDMQSRLMRYGKTSVAVTDSHFQMMTSSILTEKDLIIAFSLSGYTQDLVDSTKLAVQNEAKVIAITNHALSPLSELADVVLLTAGKESPMDGGSLSGRVSQLYLIDVLCTGFALQDEEKSLILKEKTANSIISKSLEYNKR